MVLSRNALGLWAICWGVAGCIGNDPSAEELTARSNALNQQVVTALLELEQGVLDSLSDLDAEDYEAFNAYWPAGVQQQLDRARSLAERYRVALEELSFASGNGALESARYGLGGRGPVIAIEPTTILLAGIAAGSIIAWGKKIYDETGTSMEQGQAQIDDYVARRTKMLIKKGLPPKEAERIAETEGAGGKVRLPAALGAASRVGKTLVTSTGEQAIETTLGGVPALTGVVRVKQAWDTGTLLDWDSCDDPSKQDGGKQDGTREPFSAGDGGGCRIYVGETTDGTFAGLPTGKWNMVFTSPGFEPGVVEGVEVTEGGTTEVDGSGWVKLGGAGAVPPAPDTGPDPDAGPGPDPDTGPGPDAGGEAGPKCTELAACCPTITDNVSLKADCEKYSGNKSEPGCSIMLNSLTRISYCAE